MYRYADHILYIYSLYLKSKLQCDQKYDTMLPKILHGYYRNRKNSHETYFNKHILEWNQHRNTGTTQKWSFIVLLECTSIKLNWSTLMPGSHCIATPSVLTNDGRRFDLFNNVHQFIHWRMFMGKSDLGASYSPWRSVLKKTNTVCVHCQETTEICQYPLFTWKHTLECVFAQHNIHTFHINIKRIIY